MANVGQTEESTTHPLKSDPQVTSVCCHGTEGGRNLVVNLDGTGNQFGDKNTNVVEMYSLLHKGEDSNQLSLYYSGIGTYARPSWTSFSYYKQVINHKIDLAIAWEFEKTIMGAYSWLSDNYRDGDRIFLLGFSRGAFQVRALSAMIDKVGLLYKGNNTQIPFAYELYADPLSSSGLDKVNAVGTTEKYAQKITKADRFKSAFCHKNVKVHFVGAWDTVSSIGLVRKKLLPGTIDGMKHVCFFRHALALDERRVKFLPEYAYGGTTLPPEHADQPPPLDVEDDRMTYWSLLCTFICAIISFFALSIQFSLLSIACCLIGFYTTFYFFMFVQDVIALHKGSLFKDTNGATGNPDHIIPKGSDDVGNMSSIDDKVSTPQCLEVWFAGTHSDIGGGNVHNVGMDRSRPPLRWMVHEAGALGLRMKPFTRELSSKEHIEVKESLTRLWRVLEWLPFRRLTFNGETKEGRETYRPHQGAERVVQPGQKIHGSLTLANKLGEFGGYIPKAHISRELLSRIKIPDSGTFWKNLGDKKFRDLLEVDLEHHVEGLLRMYISEQETHKEQVLNALKQIPTWSDGRQALYDACIKLLRPIGDTKSENAFDTKPAQKPLDDNESYQLVRIVEILLPVSRLRSVKLVRCRDLWGSLARFGDSEARKEDAATFFLRFTQFEDSLLQIPSSRATPWSVSFSPDGKWLASGHNDGTVWIWDLKEGSQAGKALGQHSNPVTSVAFSSDRKHLVSGSWDRTIRLWDIEQMEQVGDSWKGHTNDINCVAFSPDGTKVVSASGDETLRVWDPKTGKEVAVLKGHEHRVQSVAFSADGRHIVSGSDDQTVRIWDARTYQQDGQPLEGHIWRVLSIAYSPSESPDGMRIASGGWERKIQIWDAEMRVQLGKPLRGHSDHITSVCFSPDGKLLASGSWDCTIRIWNVDTQEQIGEGLPGLGNWVWSVAFSPDGKQLAWASEDGTIRIWDVESYVGIVKMTGSSRSLARALG